MDIETKILLREAVVAGDRSVSGLARRFGVSRPTVRWWMDRELEYVLGYDSIKDAAKARGMSEARYREVCGDRIKRI